MRDLPCAIVLLVWSVAHAAHPAVAVRPFRGPAAAKMRSGVIAALGRKVKIVKKASAAEKLIEGVVAKRGKKYKLTVTVRNSGSGTWIDDIVITLGQPSLSGAARKKLAPKVMALLGDESEPLAKGKRGKQKGKLARGGDATGAAAAFADEDGKAAPAPEPKAEPAAATSEPAPGKSEKEQEVASAQTAPDEPAPAPKPVDTEVVKEQPLGPPRAEWLTLSAGVTVQTRSFSATGFGTLPVYNSEPYGSAWIQAALYPLAFLPGPPKGLGVFGTFERAIGLKSKIAESGTVYDSLAQRWELGGGYRVHFGGATGPTFRPFVLYGQQEFVIGGMSKMPDANYVYFGGGLDFDVPLFVPSIALVGGFQYDDIGHLGGIATFGTASTGWGYELEGGLRFDLPWRLHGMAVFTDTLRHADFTGMSPTGVTASETNDKWIGGRAALTVDF